MNIPESLVAELSEWNGGAGIGLEDWNRSIGNYSEAVGYSTLFCPEFERYEKYIFRAGLEDMSVIRSWERQPGMTARDVEHVVNHVHIAELFLGAEDYSNDKASFLARKLKSVYEKTLAWSFPDSPCTVVLHDPKDEEGFIDYQLSFWQKCHE